MIRQFNRELEDANKLGIYHYVGFHSKNSR